MPIFCSQEDDFDMNSNDDDAGYGVPSSVSTLSLPATKLNYAHCIWATGAGQVDKLLDILLCDTMFAISKLKIIG